MKSCTILLGAALLFTACNGSDADETKTTDQQEAAVATGEFSYTVDTTQSTVNWTGYKPNGEHTGTFNISNGTLSGDSTGITAGNFTINVASITDKDLSGDDKAKLEGHLKSADFFEVDKYPTAKFEITRVEVYAAANDSTKKSKLQGATHFISGNLTLKDQTKNITFPARVNITADQVTANADFDIDRTQWNMNYKGPNNPQDWFIRKEVNIKLNIVAKK